MLLLSSIPFPDPAQRSEAQRAQKRLAVAQSDHLTLWRAFQGYLAARAQGGRRAASDFCKEHYLSENALSTGERVAKQYLDCMRDIGLVQAGGNRGGGNRGGGVGAPGGPVEDGDELLVGLDGSDAPQGGDDSAASGAAAGGKGSSSSSSTSPTVALHDRYASDWRVVRGAITAGLTPNIIQVRIANSAFIPHSANPTSLILPDMTHLSFI